MPIRVRRGCPCAGVAARTTAGQETGGTNSAPDVPLRQTRKRRERRVPRSWTREFVHRFRLCCQALCLGALESAAASLV